MIATLKSLWSRVKASAWLHDAAERVLWSAIEGAAATLVALTPLTSWGAVRLAAMTALGGALTAAAATVKAIAARKIGDPNTASMATPKRGT